ARRGRNATAAMTRSDDPTFAAVLPSDLELAPADEPHRLAALALAALFFLAAHANWLLRFIKPLAVRAAIAFSPQIARNTRDNASRIFGRVLDRREQREFTRAVIGNFYDFVVDAGHAARASTDDLLKRVERI